MSVEAAARLLRCPVSFYRLLAGRGLVPRGRDGMVDAHALRRARLARRWLNGLDERLSREEALRVSPDLRMPDDHLTIIAGRTYAPLWRILEYSWTDSDA